MKKNDADRRHASRRAFRAALAALGVAILALGASAEGRVYPSAEAVQPLPVGSSIPPAHVRTIAGEKVDLRKLVQGTGALLVFYRGGW